MRNFWIEVEADGYNKTHGVGPRTGDGGVMCRVKAKVDGRSEEIVHVCCHVNNYGGTKRLVIDVSDGKNDTVLSWSHEMDK